MSYTFPHTVHSGTHHGGHVQGIAVDEARGHIYFSFTTELVKTDYDGNLLGTVKGLAGHLGCIVFDPRGRRVIGSLELKHDAIGKGIISRTGRELAAEDAFYLVSFDVDAIDRTDMDAEADGIMKAVWLREVVDDYNATDEVSGKPHRYGCSGIDGTALGPVFGADSDSPKKIMVAYGVYGDTSREDNDHQVILSYDPDIFERYGQPLNQDEPHHNGPDAPEAKYFFYTGNTTYGVQNLEYDPHTHTWLAAVYTGQKAQFPNYPLYLIDGTAAPISAPLKGRGGEIGLTLAPARLGRMTDEPTPGVSFPLGATGIYAFGDGTYVFSHHGRDGEGYTSTVVKYALNPKDPLLFTECAT